MTVALQAAQVDLAVASSFVCALCCQRIAHYALPSSGGGDMLNVEEDALVTVKLQKGLADRKRLPLADVLGVLEEFRQMVAEAGRRIQRERGMPNPTGDFGLELVAGEAGSLFKPGSVQAPLAITSNTAIGILAVQEVVRTLNTLEQNEGVPEQNRQYDRLMLRRISRVARIQKRDHMELQISLNRPGIEIPDIATFGTSGMASLTALQTPTLEIQGMSVYGKLIELVDHDESDEDGKGFWGELRRDSGEPWRVQFRSSEGDHVTSMFRKQVIVTGRAVYYNATRPKIVAESIALDTDRDYEAAFDEIFGSYKNVFNADLSTLIKRNREDE
jgi:hypothetical protein